MIIIASLSASFPEIIVIYFYMKVNDGYTSLTVKQPIVRASSVQESVMSFFVSSVPKEDYVSVISERA